MWIWIILTGIGAIGAYFSANRNLIATIGGLLLGFCSLYGLAMSSIGITLSFLTLGALPLITFILSFIIGYGVTYASYWVVGKLAGKLESD